ncbi:MAG: hypothetical protein ACUVUH_07700 [bacterium]
MTRKTFVKKIANAKRDLLREFVCFLRKKRIPFCVIGGLAVNAYAEPVVSLDLDLVVAAKKVNNLLPLLSKKYRVKRFTNSINISAPYSDLRIQIQTDPRYQEFIKRAKIKNILSYKLPVACIEDVLQGKIWAFQDEQRRSSKRQKDLADIMRLLEADHKISVLIPDDIKRKLVL